MRSNVCAHLYMCMYVCVYINICVCMCIYICLCICIYLYIEREEDGCVYEYANMYIWDVYGYVYVHVHVYVHARVHVHVCAYARVGVKGGKIECISWSDAARERKKERKN